MKQNITKLQLAQTPNFAPLHPPDPTLLETKSLAELYETGFVFGQPIIEGLLFPGVYLLAGDSKIGKSFLVSQLAFHVATGTEIWERQTWRSTVLYLALEDQFSRIQQRMYRMIGTTETEDLHFAVNAKTLDDGLENQLEAFISERQNTQLIIIDTLQKIRGETGSYAKDYDVISGLKHFAESHENCLLLVHHTRKQHSSDPFGKINGTTGLMGAADGVWLLSKDDRTKRFSWSTRTVTDILGRREYCGDTINFRYTTKSFKNQTRVTRPPEDWQIFEETHPAIIDRETFALVQELREHRRRRTQTGRISMFSGMLYCEGCASKLNHCNSKGKYATPYFFCSSYRKETSNCSAHYIREEVVYKIVLETMQRIFRSIQLFEDPFIAKQREHFGIEQKREQFAKRRVLDKAKNRVQEIDVLIQRMYEDNATDKISDERYATLSSALETEQKELKEKLPAMEAELNQQITLDEGLERFVAKAKQITDLQELTPELLHEFIEKIVVHERKYLDGKRYQIIDIYFYGVGIIKELTPEEMEAEFQKLAKQEKSA